MRYFWGSTEENLHLIYMKFRDFPFFRVLGCDFGVYKARFCNFSFLMTHYKVRSKIARCVHFLLSSEIAPCFKKCVESVTQNITKFRPYFVVLHMTDGEWQKYYRKNVKCARIRNQVVLHSPCVCYEPIVACFTDQWVGQYSQRDSVLSHTYRTLLDSSWR